jgi:WD repeat-containing protein 92
VAGYDNGDIKLFDLRANSIRFETNVSNGVTSVEFDRKDIEMNKMVVTTLESKFRLFDMRTQHPTGSFHSFSLPPPSPLPRRLHLFDREGS